MGQFPTTRYPQMPDNIDPAIRDTFSELIRTLDTRDGEDMVPEEIFGRTLQVDINNLIPDGSSGGFTIYKIDIPRDVGTIYVKYPEVDTQEWIRVFLPDSRLVAGRTIAVTAENPASLTSYRLSVSVAAGSGNTFVQLPATTYPVAGPITATTTVTAPIITGSLTVEPGGDVYLPIHIANNTGAGGQLYVTSGGLLTTTPQTTFPLARVPAGALAVGGTLTNSVPTATTTVNASGLQAEVLAGVVSWPFQVRAYFDKWLVISRS